MTRAKKKRIRRIEKQEADSQAWWEEHKDDEPFDDGNAGFGTQIAHPLDFFLKKVLEERREKLSPDQRMMIALLTKPDDLSFI